MKTQSSCRANRDNIRSEHNGRSGGNNGKAAMGRERKHVSEHGRQSTRSPAKDGRATASAKTVAIMAMALMVFASASLFITNDESYGNDPYDEYDFNDFSAILGAGGASVQAVAAGNGHSLALLADGTV